MLVGHFIPCYIEAVFQEAGIAAVCPRCRLPARPGHCGRRMAMTWNAPSIFPFIHARVHRVVKSSFGWARFRCGQEGHLPKDQAKIYFTRGDFPWVPSPNNYLYRYCSIESSLGGILPRPSRSVMSEDDVEGVAEYEGAAAGWGALKAVADAVRDQKAIVKETRGLLKMKQPHGHDFPGSAWPDP